MRTTIHLLTVVAVALSCAATGGQRTITATVEGGAGRMLYFERLNGNKPVHTDSVKLDAKGHGVLKVPALPYDLYALSLGGPDLLLLALDSTDALKVTTKAADLSRPTAIEGSPETRVLHDYFQLANTFAEQRKALVDKLNADRSDTASFRLLTEANSAFYTSSKAFAEAHVGSIGGLFAMQNLNMQQELPLFQRVHDAMQKRMPHSEYYAGFDQQLQRALQQMAAEKAQEEQMAKLDQLVPIGGPAPDFKQNTPEGTPFGLADLKGKVVLIDFWASWCGPCRREMPNVKNVYATYHPKGFEILGVSLDRDKAAWLGAIQQDGLTWHHVSDLGYWNNAVAQQYGVSSIPFTVLVGRDGKVIAKNLRGPELEQKLAEVFH